MSATAESIAEPPALEHVRAIYLAARAVSYETRGELAGDLRWPSHDNPANRWGEIVARRERVGVDDTVRTAGKKVVREAGAGDRGRAVRRAVKSLVAAVGELASFQPVYVVGEEYVYELDRSIPFYYPDEGSAARLDELRQRVFVRLVELDELLRDHPDPMSRVLAVLRRIAVKLLPTAEGERVRWWFERLEADAGDG